MGGGGCDEGPWHYVDAVGEPPFENGWTNRGGGYVPTRFRTICDEVEIEIEATGPQGTVVFTLPTGFTPPYIIEGTVGDGTAKGAQNIQVNPDGTVYAE